MRPKIMKAPILLVVSLAVFTPTATFAQNSSPFAVAKCDPEAVTFSNIHLPTTVLANGQPLAAGIYQVRITTDHPAPAIGQSPSGECWVEFVKQGTVVGREVASVVSAAEISAVVKEPEPKPDAARVDLLKGGEYLRVWMNSAGTHYIVNLAVAR
jgi:hypothetical protein